MRTTNCAERPARHTNPLQQNRPPDPSPSLIPGPFQPPSDYHPLRGTTLDRTILCTAITPRLPSPIHDCIFEEALTCLGGSPSVYYAHKCEDQTAESRLARGVPEEDPLAVDNAVDPLDPFHDTLEPEQLPLLGGVGPLDVQPRCPQCRAVRRVLITRVRHPEFGGALPGVSGWFKSVSVRPRSSLSTYRVSSSFEVRANLNVLMRADPSSLASGVRFWAPDYDKIRNVLWAPANYARDREFVWKVFAWQVDMLLRLVTMSREAFTPIFKAGMVAARTDRRAAERLEECPSPGLVDRIKLLELCSDRLTSDPSYAARLFREASYALRDCHQYSGGISGFRGPAGRGTQVRCYPKFQVSGVSMLESEPERPPFGLVRREFMFCAARLDGHFRGLALVGSGQADYEGHLAVHRKVRELARSASDFWRELRLSGPRLNEAKLVKNWAPLVRALGIREKRYRLEAARLIRRHLEGPMPHRHLSPWARRSLRRKLASLGAYVTVATGSKNGHGRMVPHVLLDLLEKAKAGRPLAPTDPARAS